MLSSNYKVNLQDTVGIFMSKKISMLSIWFVSILIISNNYFSEYLVVVASLGLVLVGFINSVKHKYITYLAMLFVITISYYLPEIIIFYPLIIYTLEIQSIRDFIVYLLPLLAFVLFKKIYLVQILISFTLTMVFYYKDYIYESLSNSYSEYFGQSRKLQDDLTSLNKQLQESQNKGISIALLEERNRIARDIHDGVGHTISRGILQLGALIVSSKDETEIEKLKELNLTLKSSMDQLRKSVHNIVEEKINLKNSLDEIVTKFNFCKLDYHYSLTYEFDTKDIYSIIFIVKEALNNITKHSNASKASLSIRESKDYVFILIVDNGTVSENIKYGMGIYSISNRVKDMNANLDISTENGFRIFITIPK